MSHGETTSGDCAGIRGRQGIIISQGTFEANLGGAFKKGEGGSGDVAARWVGTDGREAESVLLDTSGDILHPFIFWEDIVWLSAGRAVGPPAVRGLGRRQENS